MSKYWDQNVAKIKSHEKPTVTVKKHTNIVCNNEYLVKQGKHSTIVHDRGRAIETAVKWGGKK